MKNRGWGESRQPIGPSCRRPGLLGRRLERLASRGLGGLLLCGLVLGSSLAIGQVRHDEVVLSSGQTLVGSVEERRVGPQNQAELVVSLEDGSVLILQREMFRSWKAEPAAMSEYRERRSRAMATVDSQWELAAWCRENKLKSPASTHARMVLELDPEHELARRLLEHQKIQNRWVDVDEVKSRLGYVKINNRWVLPEVDDLLKVLVEQRDRQRGWKRDLTSLFKTAFSTSRKAGEAWEQIRSIRDPEAVATLVELLGSRTDPRERRLLVEVLGEIPSLASSYALLDYFLLNADDAEGRERALQSIKRRPEHKVFLARKLVTQLDPDLLGDRSKMPDEATASRNTARLSRAATALRELEVPIGIEPLIVAMRISYNVKIKGQDGASSGPGGVQGVGSGAREINKFFEHENGAALEALQKLTGQRLGNSQEQWMRWWISVNTPKDLDLRRDY